MQDYDAEALSETEIDMISAVRAGDVADLGGGSVRADVLVRCMIDLSDDDDLHVGAIKVRRGIIEGAVDFEGCEISKALSLASVTVNGQRNRGAIILRDSQFRRLTLQNCTLEGGLIADRANISGGILVGGGRINGQISLRGAMSGGAISVGGTKLGDGKTAFIANGLNSAGPVALKDGKFFGSVMLERSRLHAGFSGERMTVKPDEAIETEEPALSFASARIEGDFVLDRARIFDAVYLDNIRVAGAVSAIGVDIKRGGLSANALSVTQSVELDEARIAGTLIIDGAEIGKRLSGERLDIDGGEVAISARVARIGSDVSVPRMRAIGEIWLPGAQITGQLRMTEAMLYGADLAVRADGIRVDGGWFMSRSTIVGLVRLPAAKLGNQFRMRDATVKVEHGAALMAHGASFARDVQLDDTFNTIGAVVFDQCEIRGTLTFADSRIKSAAIARGVSDPGATRAVAARAPTTTTSDGPADFDESAISLIDAKIGRLRMPVRAEQRPRGIVDLSRATAGSFEDFAATWPDPRTRSFAGGRDIDHLVLDGFTYAHLENPSGASEAGQGPGRQGNTSSRRVQWLMGQRESDVTVTFKPQPWVALAERLAAQGYDAASRDVAIVQRRRARKAYAVTRGERWQSRLLDWFALYGFNPWRTVAWMLFVVAAYSVLWSWAAGYCTEAGCVDETIFVKTAMDGYSQTGLARGYPDFHAFAYSIDLFLPFVDFGFDSHWRVNMRYGELFVIPVPSAQAIVSLLLGGEPHSLIADLRITLGSVLYALAFLERVLGLLLTSLAVTAFTGLLRPRN